MTASDLRGEPWRSAVWTVTEPAYESDLLNPDLVISPWQCHRDFAYDLISFVKPRLIVELGVHYGCSYFAFCQAVKDRALASRVVGIDTWTGDEHAGFYGEEVFDLVTRTRASYFADERYVLRRCAFNEALGEFSDGSIDLLHIDGFHAYEAVHGDFTAWLPKLAEHGIVLLHDVAPSSGYGSARFWSELKQRHPHFEFLNKWGLGIVFPKGDRWYSAGLRECVPDKIRGYRYRGEWLEDRRRAAMDLQFQREQTDLWWRKCESYKRTSEIYQTQAVELEKWLRICTLGLSRLFLPSGRE